MAGTFRQDDRMFWDRINKINGIGLVVEEVYDHLRDRMIRQAKFALSPATSYPLLVTSGPVARRRSQTALFGKIIERFLIKISK